MHQLKKVAKKFLKITLSPFIKSDQQNNTYTPLIKCRSSLNAFQTNKLIAEMLTRNDPVMIGRLGRVELKAMIAHENYSRMNSIERIYEWANHGYLPYSKDSFMNFTKNAGFFPIEKHHIQKFYDLMIESMETVDILGSSAETESKYAEHLINTKVCSLPDLEPYYYEEPWSRTLYKKKVLVIHPFVESIKHQFNLNRELLFPGKDVLPEFELHCLPAVQSIAGTASNYSSWYDAFESMLDKTKAIDFDIAIIGCGAYGFPLAAKIKQNGKKAIHLGGATQILFGIKGARWDTHPIISKFYNQHWIRPASSEIPKNYKAVENGCYW